jgi:2-keto-4-pentenoate hydratase/2-oxohepta-3-ene-1,7-dioic acid hydratase in catechol pathway
MSILKFNGRKGKDKIGYLLGSRIIDISNQTKDEIIALKNIQKVLKKAVKNRGNLKGKPRKKVKLLPPVKPSKIIRLDGCYEHDITDKGYDPHLEAIGVGEMPNPTLWVAPDSTLVGDGSTVQIPIQVESVRPGVVLGVVVGSEGWQVSAQEGRRMIAGLTVCIDLRAEDDLPGLYGFKMFDGFLPCGPVVVPYSDIHEGVLALGLRRNQSPVDARSTNQLRFSIPEMVSYASHVMTLKPGDLITTGTPTRGAPALEEGDAIEAWIESIGTLRTTVRWSNE